jgi:Flp pilus assembly pilin Flp
MTSVLTAAAVEQGPAWGGFAVVMVMLALSLVAAVTDLFSRAGDDVERMVDEALTIDHEQCQHDGCDVVRVEDCEGCRTDARADAWVPW